MYFLFVILDKNTLFNLNQVRSSVLWKWKLKIRSSQGRMLNWYLHKLEAKKVPLASNIITGSPFCHPKHPSTPPQQTPPPIYLCLILLAPWQSTTITLSENHAFSCKLLYEAVQEPGLHSGLDSRLLASQVLNVGWRQAIQYQRE